MILLQQSIYIFDLWRRHFEYFKLYKHCLHIFLNVGVRGGRDLAEMYGNVMGNIIFF